MKHVEEGEVGKLLLEDEKERVKHVNKFGNIEEPSKAKCPHCLWII